MKEQREEEREQRKERNEYKRRVKERGGGFFIAQNTPTTLLLLYLWLRLWMCKAVKVKCMLVKNDPAWQGVAYKPPQCILHQWHCVFGDVCLVAFAGQHARQGHEWCLPCTDRQQLAPLRSNGFILHKIVLSQDVKKTSIERPWNEHNPIWPYI